MTKKLSSWEVTHREAEHRQTIRLRAELRRTEREAQAKQRTRERAAQLRQREQEAARSAAQRDKEELASQKTKETQLRAWESEVATYDAYVDALSSFHRTPSRIENAEDEFRTRLQRRAYQRRVFAPRHFGETLPHVRFEAEIFEPHSFAKSDLRRSESTTALTNLAPIVLTAGLLAWWLISGYSSDTITLGMVAGAGGAGSFFLVSVIAYLVGIRFRRQHSQQEIRRREEFDASESARKEKFQQEQSAARSAFEQEQAAARSAFELKRQAFDAEEKIRAEKFEDQEDRNAVAFDRNEVERIDVLSKAMAGGGEEIGLILEALLPLDFGIAYPNEVTGRVGDYEVGYQVITPATVQVAIQLPDVSVVPSAWVEMTPARTKVKRGNWTESNRNKTYRNLIASFCLGHAAGIVLAYPFLHSVLIEATRLTTDPATGLVVDELVLQIDFSKEGLATIDLSGVDAVESLNAFQGTFRPPGKKLSAPLTSRIDRTRLIWATEEDEGFSIPFGLIPSQKSLVIANPFAG